MVFFFKGYSFNFLSFVIILSFLSKGKKVLSKDYQNLTCKVKNIFNANSKMIIDLKIKSVLQGLGAVV